MLDINSTPEDILAVAIDKLNTGLSYAAGAPMAAPYFAAAQAAAEVARAVAAIRPTILEYTDGYIAGADSEVDLVVNLDGTTEAGITPAEAAVRQATEAFEAEEADALERAVDIIRSKGDDPTLEDVIETRDPAAATSDFLRDAGLDEMADGIEADFGAPAASPVFTEALAEQKAGAKKKGKKS